MWKVNQIIHFQVMEVDGYNDLNNTFIAREHKQINYIYKLNQMNKNDIHCHIEYMYNKYM